MLNFLINFGQILLVIFIIVGSCVLGWFWGLASIKKERKMKNNTLNNEEEII